MKQYNPKPAETYDLLLRQFQGLVTIINAKEVALQHYKSERDHLLEQIKLCDQSEIESQRQANTELTRRIAELEELIK